MNSISTPSPLAMTGKKRIVGTRAEGFNKRGERGKQVTAKVDDGQPAWVSRTPIGKQDERPMFKHVVLKDNGAKADWDHTYLGTRLITTKDKTGTHAKYADLYYDEFSLHVVARWSNKVDDVTVGTLKDKSKPGINAAIKIAQRRNLQVRTGDLD